MYTLVIRETADARSIGGSTTTMGYEYDNDGEERVLPVGMLT